MSTAAPDPFSAEIAAAVTGHMNGDHPEDCLLIVRGLGGLPEATDASMSSISPEGAQFTAETEGGPRQVVIPWAEPVTERAHLRLEVVRMYHEACVALGVEPRQAEEH